MNIYIIIDYKMCLFYKTSSMLAQRLYQLSLEQKCNESSYMYTVHTYSPITVLLTIHHRYDTKS